VSSPLATLTAMATKITHDWSKLGKNCINCVHDTALEYDAEVNVIVFKENYYLYKLAKHDEEYMFALPVIKTERDKKETFRLDAVEDQETNIGDRFEYTVTASRKATYKDFTPIFDISSDGRIDFVPIADDLGEYVVLIEGTDEEGNRDTVSFNLNITGFNSGPKIGPIYDTEIKVGERWSYQVVASDSEEEDLIFSDNTELFDIDAITGVIDFTPAEEDVGVHNIIISTAYDMRGGHDEEQYKLTITK